MASDETPELPPLIKGQIYNLLERIERNRTDLKTDLNRSWEIYSNKLEMTHLDKESFQIGYFMGFFESYFRNLFFSVLERKPSSDETTYFLEIMRTQMDRIMNTLRR